MEYSELQALAEEYAGEFRLQISELQQRHKKSFISVRRRGNALLISLQTGIETMEPDIIKAFLYTSIAKVAKSPFSPKYRQYRNLLHQYRDQGYFSSRLRQNPAINVKINDPKGQFFDLTILSEQIMQEFRSLFGAYFDENPPKIGWSRRRGYRRMGAYFASCHTITINNGLDSSKVPVYVVRYVLYHELIHAFLGWQKKAGKSWVHHVRFHEMESIFPEYDKANAFLKSYATFLHHNGKAMHPK